MLPVRYHIAAGGLDASWAVALNYFRGKNIIFGRDVAFTYGPLSWLTLPMTFGANLRDGIVFQTASWIVFIGLLAWFAFVRKSSVLSFAIFALCTIPGSRILHDTGYAGPDLFVLFVALLSLAAALFGGSAFYLLAIAVTAVLVLIKVSTGVAALSAVLLFPIGVMLLDRRRALRLGTIAAVAIPVSVAGAYLMYYPSFPALARYLRANFEITSSHSSAMSQGDNHQALIAALGILAAYAALLVVLYLLKQPSFSFALATCGPLFLEFKHTFVREAGHIEIFFRFAPMVVGMVLLLTRGPVKRLWPVAAAASLIFVPWYYWERPNLRWSSVTSTLQVSIDTLREVVHFSQLESRLKTESAQALQIDRLPPDLLSRIGGRPVTIFPWECSYAAANSIDYRPLPVFQTYQAAGPYLDKWNAEFLAGPKSPDFVIFDWQSIDGRHPLLDTPAATLAMFRNYQFDGVFGPIMLLRKRDTPIADTARLVKTMDWRVDEPLVFPSSESPLTALLFLKFNLLGKLANLFFRVPELRAGLSSDVSRYVIARVPPLVLPDGILINALPANATEMRNLFEHGTAEEALTMLAVDGPGVSYLEKTAHVEVYELSGTKLQFTTQSKTSRIPDLRALVNLGSWKNTRFDLLNSQAVTDVGDDVVIEVTDKQRYILVQGWIVDPFETTEGTRVFVSLDGKLYPATYGGDRPDVLKAFPTKGARHPGFQWSVPTWKLQTGQHELGLRMVSGDGKSYYEGRGNLKFRLVK
jgi:hypothetical protein